MMKRPASDTLDGSRFSNIKELRFEVDNGVWRVAYAFDPTRKAILLVINRAYRRSDFTGPLSERPTKGLRSTWKNWEKRGKENENERSL
jgi:Phage derived protein Gp49-like (DUF891)